MSLRGSEVGSAVEKVVAWLYWARGVLSPRGERNGWGSRLGIYTVPRNVCTSSFVAMVMGVRGLAGYVGVVGLRTQIRSTFKEDGSDACGETESRGLRHRHYPPFAAESHAKTSTGYDGSCDNVAR